ncbi:MAG: hypothetical protein ACP5TY_08700 [Thermodesulforhabdaceae bacterium]|jgi:hypothetical protein
MAQTQKKKSGQEVVKKPAPNPVRCKEGKGVRNFDCPYYDDCLDKAARAMWPGFTCAECENYEEQSG